VLDDGWHMVMYSGIFFYVTTLLQQRMGECGQIILPQQKCHYQPQDYRYYYNNITPSSPVTFYAIYYPALILNKKHTHPYTGRKQILK
jgi:hypothetical protein